MPGHRSERKAAESQHQGLCATCCFESHRVAEMNDGLTYREAFTPGSAQAIRDYLVNECGLRLDLDDAPEPGRFVFAFKKTPVATR